MSNTYTFPIEVVEEAKATTDFSKLLGKEKENKEDLPAPIITYETVDYLDNLKISFNELMLFPDGIKNFTDSNEGANVFNITYLPSESTLDYFYQQEITSEMSWRISEVDPKFIQFELVFTNPTAVSTNALD